MKLSTQKRLAAAVLGCSHQNVRFDVTRLAEIKEALTKNDIRGLIVKGAISKVPTGSYSHGRSRLILKQKRKGRRSGPGSIKGKKYARLPRKQSWMDRVRAQRLLLKALKEGGIVTIPVYHQLYKMSKGGFFRSRNHMKLYMEEHGLVQKNERQKENSTTAKKA
ncbi:MAG: 50S ribosomal protein L19e [Nanoarchaeota archaeon]|nr:50S ribosomal protein L19e [Nanoarchaeota archaeon]